MKRMSDSVSIGTELWGYLEKPWKEGRTVIAHSGYKWVTRWEAGKPFITSKFYNDSGRLIGIYCDVARPVQQTVDGFTFEDLYLDVWQVTGENPMILDEDELDEAVEADFISGEEAEEATTIAEQLRQMLLDNDPIFKF
jgi:predicted RNA-binding protein associated with RNAse of E/G family